jgi:hypothetical protein
MKNEIICGLQGPPKAAESNTRNGPKNLRGCSVIVNPPDQLRFKAGSPAVAASAKAGQTDLLGQIGGESCVTALK